MYLPQILQYANIINDAIRDIDPNIRIISEPGSYYVMSAFTLVSQLHSKKVVLRNGGKMRMYYMNCSLYHSFMIHFFSLGFNIPEFLSEVILM